MHSFTDNHGRTWSININIAAVKRVRSAMDIDLLDAVGGELLTRLADNIVMLVDLVYFLVKPEADNAGVSDEQFGEALAGPALDDAANAFMAELADFFPEAKGRVLRKAIAKVRQVETRAAEVAEQRLEDPLLAAKVESILLKSGESSGGAQG